MPHFHWDDHSAHFMSAVRELYKNAEFIDCTLDTNGGLVHGHKTILASSSPYLKKLFLDHHGMNIIPLKEVEYHVMKLILDFVYFGAVDVSATDVASLIEASGFLQITSLRCNSQKFSEKCCTNRSCVRSITSSVSDCDENLKGNEKSDSFVHDTVVIHNQDIVYENEDRSTDVNCDSIDLQATNGYKENTLSDSKGSPRKPNEILAKTHNEISSVMNMDDSNKGKDNLEDKLSLITFVAVSPFSVKTEHIDDEQSAFCVCSSELKNPLEVNSVETDSMKVINVKEEKEFQSESEVKIEIKEEKDFCEFGQEVNNGALMRKSLPIYSGEEREGISYEMLPSLEGSSATIDNNMLLATDNICSKGRKENGTVTKPEHSIYSEEYFCERTEDLELEFQSICDVSKSDLKEEKPVETGWDIERVDNNSLLPFNKVSEILKHGEEEMKVTYEQNFIEGLGVPTTKRLKCKEGRVVLERISPSLESSVAKRHSAVGNVCGSSKMRIEFSKDEYQLKKCSKEDSRCSLSSETSQDRHLTSGANNSFYFTENMLDTSSYKKELREQLLNVTLQPTTATPSTSQPNSLCAECQTSSSAASYNQIPH